LYYYIDISGHLVMGYAPYLLVDFFFGTVRMMCWYVKACLHYYLDQV